MAFESQGTVRGGGCFGAFASISFLALTLLSVLTVVAVVANPSRAKSSKRSVADEEPEAERASAPRRKASTTTTQPSGNPWVNAETCGKLLLDRRYADARRECEAGLAIAKAPDVTRALHLNLGLIAEADGDKARAEDHFLTGLAWGFDTRFAAALPRVSTLKTTKWQRWSRVKLPQTARNGTVRRLPRLTADEVSTLDRDIRVYLETCVSEPSGATWCAVRTEATEPPIGWMHAGILEIDRR